MGVAFTYPIKVNNLEAAAQYIHKCYEIVLFSAEIRQYIN